LGCGVLLLTAGHGVRADNGRLCPTEVAGSKAAGAPSTGRRRSAVGDRVGQG
jgi:hypothetical protein